MRGQGRGSMRCESGCSGGGSPPPLPAAMICRGHPLVSPRTLLPGRRAPPIWLCTALTPLPPDPRQHQATFQRTQNRNSLLPNA